MSERAPIADFAIDRDRINGCLAAELSAFQQHFREPALTEAQELRSGFIAWVATFVPEIVSAEFRALLEAALRNYAREPDFQSFGWYRVLPLHVAMFSLSGRAEWLDLHRFNFDHHASTLRCYVLDTLALVAPALKFDDPELQKRATHNLSIPHADCEWCAVLLLCTRGDLARKSAQLDAWIEIPRLNSHERELLQQFRADGRVANSRFVRGFADVFLYGWLRLACGPSPVPQMVLPLHADASPVSELVWQRWRSHPLAEEILYLS